MIKCCMLLVSGFWRVKMRQIALAALVCVLAIPAQGATLTTMFSSNAQQRGNMFDILVGEQDIKITGFDLNIRDGSTANLEWYILLGGHHGFANDASAWNLVDTTSGVKSNGTDTSTHWDVSDTSDMIFLAGQTYGFYITTFGPTAPLRYTIGSGGIETVVASDTALTIFQGLGVSYPFGDTWANRIWNGTIHYETMGGTPVSFQATEVSPVPLPAAGWLFLTALGALGFAGYRRNRLSNSQA